jgi:predicted dehydrogenase/threonine dehydrogenase-like Zn-dependent dehydrogenase
VAEGVKGVLNAQANRLLGALGYSDLRAQETKREAWWWLQARWRALSRRRRLLAGAGVLWTGPGRAQLVPLELAAAGPDEVTIELLATVVSPGTERAQYLRLPNTAVEYPHFPGYSGAGRVMAAGKGVGHVKPGDLVAARGVGHVSLATIPASLVSLVPAGVAAEEAATIQLGTIAAQGVRRAALTPGESVCVIGAGLIGLLAQRLAGTVGAGPVTVVAASRTKEPVARMGGAERFLVVGEDDEAIAALKAGAVIEAAGDPAALGVAVAAADDGARIVLLGSPRGLTDLPLAEIREKGLSLIGAHVETLAAETRAAGEDVYRRQAEGYLDALASGLSVADLVDWALDPREADAVYRELAQRRDVVGARFDWARLPDGARPARLLRVPSLKARGIDHGREPIIVPRGDGSPERPRRSGRPLRIGLLGCGEIGVTNAAAIAATENTELVACFDPARPLAEELAARHGAAAHESVEALLGSSAVDAVLVAVPHHLHAELGVRAAEAGKHVIVEKPPANDLEGALRLVRAARGAEVVFSVCLPHRYQPGVLRAKELVAEGALGAFTGLLISTLSKKPETYWYGGFSGRSSSDWRASKAKAGGGFLIMNLCHYVDVVHDVIGVQPDEVTAYVEEPAGGRDVEDAISIAVRYPNGAIGSFVGSAALAGFERGRTEIRLWGRDGHLALEPELTVYSARALQGLRTGRWQRFEGVQGLGEAEIRSTYFSRLADAIANGEPPDVGPDDALSLQSFVEAAYRSHELDRPVRPAELLDELEEPSRR